MRALPGALHRGRGRARRRARRSPSGSSSRCGLLGLRVPEGALGRVRAARLPVDLAAGPLRAGVPLRAAERAADGLLSAGRAGARGAAARDRGAAAATSTSARSSAGWRPPGRRAGSAGYPPVRIGLGYVAELTEVDAEAWWPSGARGGPYADAADLAARSGAGRARWSGSPGPGRATVVGSAGAVARRLGTGPAPATDRRRRRCGRRACVRGPPCRRGRRSWRCRSTAPPPRRCPSSDRGSGCSPTTARPGSRSASTRWSCCGRALPADGARPARRSSAARRTRG